MYMSFWLQKYRLIGVHIAYSNHRHRSRRFDYSKISGLKKRKSMDIQGELFYYENIDIKIYQSINLRATVWSIRKQSYLAFTVLLFMTWLIDT